MDSKRIPRRSPGVEEWIERELVKAAKKILEDQPNFSQFTRETQQTEWNIAYHFGREIHKLFPKLDCDWDLIKRNLGRRRPDIVLHERGSHRNNYLAIEVKRSKRDVGRELAKIRKYWFAKPLKYQFGAVVVIDEKETPVAVVIKNRGKY